MNRLLTDRKEVVVRFSEVDPMQIVWHGHYLKYFEDGRESFGLKYGLGYLEVYKHQVMIPIVQIRCDYKRPLKYGDVAVVETIYRPAEAAKIIFDYAIYRGDEPDPVAKGSSIQVFLDMQGELILTPPEFYTGWKKHWGVDIP